MQLNAYPGVLLLVEAIGDRPEGTMHAHLAALDGDVLLVSEPALDLRGRATPGDWRTAILRHAEDLNLYEHMLIAWHGAGVTREIARAAGFEDGFGAEVPPSFALAIFAQETITRAAYRRRGSSPPCYL
jgi:hypothetical protein